MDISLPIGVELRASVAGLTKAVAAGLNLAPRRKLSLHLLPLLT